MDWKLGRLILATGLLAGPAVAQSLPTFLGVQLGGEFSMPKCKYTHSVRVFDQPVTPCWGEEVVLDQNKALPAGDFEIEFQADYKTTPAGVKVQRVVVVGGKVVGITVSTDGSASQDDLSSALVAKFGKPTWVNTDTLQNRMGATFERKSARWQLPGLDVGFLGIGSTIDSGLITVYTPEGRAFKDRQIAEMKARRQGQF